MKRLSSLALALLAASAAHAGVTYGFQNITSNSILATSAPQFTMEVIDFAPGQVSFRFTNALGGLQASITDIHFDDGTSLGSALVANGAGVSIFGLTNSTNLPGGASKPWFFNTGTSIAGEGQFSADQGGPGQIISGVNPGEYVEIIFSLIQGKTYADILADLQARALQVGFVVQADGDAMSDSFIDNPQDLPVPAPAAVVLALVGLGALGLAVHRLKPSC